jgi:hypothetical protein
MNKPLSTSLAEAIAAKHPEVLIRPPPPPSSRPSRVPVYDNPKPLHALPPPEGPDRTLVEKNEQAPGRKRKKRVVLSADERAAAVKRVLAGETAAAVSADIGVSVSGIQYWVREAKAQAEKDTRKRFEGNDIAKLSAELSEALNLQRAAAERVKVLKAQLRRLLEE